MCRRDPVSEARFWIAAGLLTGFLLCALLFLMGCAPTRTVRYHYPAYNLIVVDGPDAVDAVDRHCRKYCKRHDRGQPISPDEKLRACFIGKLPLPDIVVSSDHLDCLPHEICHAESISAPVCEQRYPCIGDAQ